MTVPNIGYIMARALKLSLAAQQQPLLAPGAVIISKPINILSVAVQTCSKVSLVTIPH